MQQITPIVQHIIKNILSFPWPYADISALISAHNSANMLTLQPSCVTTY